MPFSPGGSEIRPYRIRPRARRTGYEGGRSAVVGVGTLVVIPWQSFAPGLVGPHLRGGRYLVGTLFLFNMPFSPSGSEIRPYRFHPQARRTGYEGGRSAVVGVGTLVVIPWQSFAPGLVGPHLRGGRYLVGTLLLFNMPFSPGGSEIRPYRFRPRARRAGLSFEADLYSQLKRNML